MRQHWTLIASAIVASVLVVAVALLAWKWSGDTPPAGVKLPVATIDGSPVGRRTDCIGLGLTENRCARVIAAARASVDEGRPGHAAVASVTLRDTFDATKIDGRWTLLARSTTFVATVVFFLQDGSAVVQTVACGVWQPGDPICDPAVP